jgi:hypothetical protein
VKHRLQQVALSTWAREKRLDHPTGAGYRKVPVLVLVLANCSSAAPACKLVYRAGWAGLGDLEGRETAYSVILLPL